MCRKITIIGAGQSGLLLGIALLKANYQVTIFSNRTADQIYSGRILSNQAMFNKALEIECKHGLNFWENKCPQNSSITLSVASADYRNKAICWSGKQQKFYQSVDQRLKFSYWLNEFEKLGGQVKIQEVLINDLSNIAALSDLTLIAGGKGEISQIFPRDDVHSVFTEPQRVLCCLYVKGMLPAPEVDGVRVSIIPGIGEYLIMPGLTINGHCRMMQFEGVPHQAFDSWEGISNPQDQLTHGIELLKKYIPWEAEFCKQLTLADDRATLYGSFTPTIRKPVAKLPCGKSILGLADTVILNDPLAGQGANNATIAADYYYESIIANKNKIFTEEWMHETFETYWENSAKWSTLWSNILLHPPTPHVIEYFQAAEKNTNLANKLAEGFNEPRTLFPWILDPVETRRIITSSQSESSLAVMEK